MNATLNNNLPALRNEGGLSAYLEQIKKFPMLDAEEEYMLAKNWKTTGNIKSAEKLVTSHLRLVAKIAMGYFKILELSQNWNNCCSKKIIF